MNKSELIRAVHERMDKKMTMKDQLQKVERTMAEEIEVMNTDKNL